MSSPKRIQLEQLENFSISLSSVDSKLLTSESSLPDFDEVIKNGHLTEAGAAMFSEYCEYSTIHGVRYLGERKRTWKEKIFWIIVFAISIYMCVKLISDIWVKWNDTPVVVNFADKATPVWKVPFPTITICLDIKSTDDKFRFDTHVKDFNMNETIVEEWTENEKQLMDISLQICDYSKTEEFDSFTQKIFYASMLSGIEYMAPNRSTFIYTKFLDYNNDTEDSRPYFDRILTEMGICYSFNLLELTDVYRENVVFDELLLSNDFKRTTKWNLQNGFNGPAKNEKFPYRTYSSFFEHGLKVKLQGKIDDIDLVCGEGDEGFKIAISTPGDIPQLSKQFISVPFNYEVLIDVTPDMITISDTAADYSPEIRKCYFESEKYLSFFKMYSQSNCELECLTNYTLQKCGCVRFNMPRNEKTLVCGAKSIKCYLEAKKELLEFEFLKNNMNASKKQIPDCKCLPTCTSLLYKIGVTQAPLSSIAQDESSKVTNIQIYYKDDRFWGAERAKLYGPIQFTANAGGLLGLFMGVSILSLVEFIYFCTIRLCTNLKMRYTSKTVKNDKNEIKYA